MVVDEGWRIDLERWLVPFLAGLTHPARRRMCPQYIAGLIGPGDCKSVQLMAARGGEAGYDQLHHFVAAGIWDSAPLEAALLRKPPRWLVAPVPILSSITRRCRGRSSLGRRSTAIRLVAGQERELSDAGLGDAGVARGAGDGGPPAVPAGKPDLQSGAHGKGEGASRPTGRPDQAGDRHRRDRQSQAAGVRFGCVLADAEYGMSAPFRQALSERGLSWAVGIPCRQKVYAADVAMIFPVSGHGRPRQHHIPDSKSVAAEKLLAGQPWRSVSWRRGTKGRLSARFAAVRRRVAVGPGVLAAAVRVIDQPLERAPARLRPLP